MEELNVGIIGYGRESFIKKTLAELAAEEKTHPRVDMSSGLTTYRRTSIQAAKDLFYSDDVIQDIKYAKTVGEIERIMIKARKNSSPQWP